MLDDDKPDYFLSDETPDPKTSANPQEKSDRTIDFGGEAGTPAAGAAGIGSARPVEERKRRHRGRKVLVWTIVIGLLILSGAFYLRYCSPYVEDAAMRCYIVNVEKRGLIFKTYEGQAVSAESVADTTKIYSHPEQFSFASDELARQAQSYQGTNIPVTVRYEKFYATLPWRGASKWVVTSIEPDKVQ